AYSEFFGLSGGLNTSYKQSKTFYILFLGQLLIAAVVVSFPGINLFKLAITTQGINATMLPLVFFYLIRLASNPKIMNEHVNRPFQKYIAITGMVLIFIASMASLASVVFGVGS
ncbi:hypothetical protein FDZ74_09530, partial [bacterium]